VIITCLLIIGRGCKTSSQTVLDQRPGTFTGLSKMEDSGSEASDSAKFGQEQILLDNLAHSSWIHGCKLTPIGAGSIEVHIYIPAWGDTATQLFYNEHRSVSSLLLELHRDSVVDNKLSLHLLKLTSVTNPFVFSTIWCSASPVLHSRCQQFGLETPWWLERTDENQVTLVVAMWLTEYHYFFGRTLKLEK
jgi:hypothetical protein